MEKKQRKKGLRYKEYTEVGFVVCVLALWAMGGAVTAGVEEGQPVFADKKCITCHTLYFVKE